MKIPALKFGPPAAYLPMLAGALVGYLVGYFGWHATAGMVAGAVVWLAYELRKNSRTTQAQIEQMERHLVEYQRISQAGINAGPNLQQQRGFSGELH